MPERGGRQLKAINSARRHTVDRRGGDGRVLLTWQRYGVVRTVDASFSLRFRSTFQSEEEESGWQRLTRRCILERWQFHGRKKTNNALMRGCRLFNCVRAQQTKSLLSGESFNRMHGKLKRSILFFFFSMEEIADLIKCFVPVDWRRWIDCHSNGFAHNIGRVLHFR